MCSILFNKILQDLSKNTSKKNLLASSPRRFGRDQNAILSTKNTCLGQKMALLQRLDISILCIIQVSILFIIKGIMMKISFLMCRALHQRGSSWINYCTNFWPIWWNNFTAMSQKPEAGLGRGGLTVIPRVPRSWGPGFGSGRHVARVRTHVVQFGSHNSGARLSC